MREGWRECGNEYLRYYRWKRTRITLIFFAQTTDPRTGLIEEARYVLDAGRRGVCEMASQLPNWEAAQEWAESKIPMVAGMSL